MQVKELCTPKQLAQALNLGESTIKRWVDDGHIQAQRTAGGHRRIPLSEALRFIRERGLSLHRAEALGLALSPHAAAIDMLLAGSHGDLARYLQQQYGQGRSLAELFDQELAPAMHHIGTLWTRHDDGIMVEHRAVDCCLYALAQLRALLPQPPADAPLALGGAPAGDPYVLPSAMVAMLLQQRGWQATNLAGNTPQATLLNAVESQKPKLLWLCITTAYGACLWEDLQALQAACASNNCQLIVGGQSLPGDDELPAGPFYGRNMLATAAYLDALKSA